MHRLAIFMKNLQKIEEFNELYSEYEGIVLGVNQFADWTKEEYSKLLGYKETQKAHKVSKNSIQQTKISQDLNETLNWVDFGAVTSVKDQRQCGSCWAFATVGAIEGAYFIKNKILEEFSEQQLVDCSLNNAGCNGGLMMFAYEYLEKYSLERFIDYPYTGYSGRCYYEEVFGKV